MDAVGQGATTSQELMEEIGKVEAELRRRLPIGWSTSLATLRRELCVNRGYSENALSKSSFTRIPPQGSREILIHLYVRGSPGTGDIITKRYDTI